MTCCDAPHSRMLNLPLILMFMIDIAIRTYNCEVWIDTLFESILSQDFQDWRIVVRDDASKDNTPQILNTWKARLKEKLLLIEDSAGNLGIMPNCDAVLSSSTAPYVMLADPDDVYLPGKISTTFKAMRSAEERAGKTCPIAVCTDASVVDGNLRPLVPSYWKWSHQNPKLLNIFHRMIVESPALNSTMMVNRALLDKALPVAGSLYPDWWLAMVACAFGQIVHLPQTTILYRRHSSNDTLEPMTATLSSASRRISQSRTRVEKLLSEYAQQAGVFLRRYGGEIQPSDAAALRAAHSLPSLNFFARRHAIIRHRLWFASPVKNVGLMLLA